MGASADASTAPASPPRERATHARGGKHALDLGRDGTFAACARALEDALATSESQSDEDFRLIDVMATRVAMTCENDLLASLARDETGAALEALARALASEREDGEAWDGDLRVTYERARGKIVAKVTALTEAHAANRADRIKLLTELVTANRLSTLTQKHPGESRVLDRE